MTTVVCVLPFLSRRDAVSNDSRMLLAVLQGAGYDAHLYAELFQPGCEAESISLADLNRLTRAKDTIVLVQMCVAWAPLEAFLSEVQGPVVLRYHNMTPPQFFDRYDQQAAYATRAGLAQMGRIYHHPKLRMLMACSTFNLGDAAATWGVFAGKTAVVAPFMALEPTASSDDPAVLEQLEDGRVQLFFIGRWAPNKGHHHMIGVLNSYRELYGEDICLTIAGSLAANFVSYQQQITALAAELGLTRQLRIVGGLSDAELVTYLRHATAFLLCSEHEGFCVPIIEAQTLGLPVVALDATAVGETLGPQQLLFPTPDYDLFAASVNRLHRDQAFKAAVAGQGLGNSARFSPETTAQRFLAALAELS